MSTSTSERVTTSGLSKRRAEWSFWIVALAFVIATSFTTTPTPLWTIYQQTDGFETVWLTIAFSSYVVGVIISLLFFGHVSDWKGRRPLLLIAIGLQIVAAALFLSSTALPVLIIARAICGLGIGILTATATAFLAELNARSGRTPVFAVVVATAANMGGLGLGPIIGGLFSEYSANPLRSPWLMYVIVLAAAFVIAWLPRETVVPDRQRRYRMQRIVISNEHRPTYLASAAGGFAFFAICGLSGSLEPKFLAQLGISSHLVAGIASAAVFLSGAIAQIVFARLRATVQLNIGFSLVAIAAVAMALGASIPGWLWVFVVGAIVGGAGGGILLKGALGTAARLAPAGHVGESTAGIFIAAFLGMGLPVVVIGILTTAGVSLTASMIGFSIMVLAVVVSAAVTLARHPAP